MIIEDNNIELRSEEFQEILGDLPPWIFRWGIAILAFVVLVIFIGSSIFKYPDTISATMLLTRTTPAATIVAKSSGKLNELYVIDNQNINKGEYLAVIENTAKTEDILFLKNYLASINLDSISVLPPKHLQLGSIQSNYTSFFLTLFEYTEYKRLKYLSTKAEIARTRIEQYSVQCETFRKQKKIIEKQFAINKNKYARDSILNQKGVISLEDLEAAKNELLRSQLACEDICSSINNSQIQIGEMRESLFDTNYQKEEKENTLQMQLKAHITQLCADLQEWELSYALIAPIDGNITFTNYWAINQNIEQGDDIFNIIPLGDDKLIGKASLPITRSGKVKKGQRVNIRFENFPDHEFGMVRGIVQNISLVASKKNNESNYIVEVELPEGLNSSYNIELPYLPEMKANADIITEDLSLLQRFFMPIRKILKENF